MKAALHFFFTVLIMSTVLMACNENDTNPNALNSITEDEETNNSTPDDQTNNSNNDPLTFKLLSLGDSYTIGESVCETCRFPAQLRDSISQNIQNSSVDLQIIAQTGWTTTNLISAIESTNPETDFDLVTLLIGVNNQYQHRPFSLYEQEFPQLVSTAIQKAKSNPDKVIVISIPDYAYTPFGQNSSNPENISYEIDLYNNFAEQYCNQNNIAYVYITDITREGLANPGLVASDNLHPSELAYSRFVERILPVALEKLQ